MGGVEAGAISDWEADCALAPLAQFPAVLLAVSGGPDSMALMYLAAAWSQRLKGTAPRLCVATVDHGLRTESAQEAAFVARAAAALGFEHRTLRWTGEKPATGVPAAARAARYDLLEAAALSFGGTDPVALAVAHTRDDQAETFLMRLKRGSGVEGLSGMALSRPLKADSRVSLVRPLLAMPKLRLMATLTAYGAAWIDDPTNVDQDHERPRVRVLLATMEEQGLTAASIARSAARLKAANEALGYADGRFREDVSLRIEDEVLARAIAAAVRSGPELLRVRLLCNLIARFGGATPHPRLSEAEDLARRLSSTDELRATLGGAVVSQGRSWLRVWREPGRIDPAPLKLEPGTWRLWDDRFWVRSPGTGPQVSVRALEADGRRAIAGWLRRPLPWPASAVRALPSFWDGGQIVGVPALEPYLVPPAERGAAFAHVLEIRPRVSS